MFGILADHPHHTFAMDDLALIANFLYRCSYLHNPVLSSAFSVIADSCFLAITRETAYLYRYTILPRFRSYGDNSTATLSPGRMRMKFLRILPETCASTWCLFSSSTRNMALGSGSITVAITSIASSLLIHTRHKYPVPTFQYPVPNLLGPDAHSLRLLGQDQMPIFRYCHAMLE